MFKDHESTYQHIKVKSLRCVQLFVTLWTIAYQASPSMGFSGQEYWSGLPFPSPGDFPDLGIKPTSPALQVGSLPLSHQGSYPGVKLLLFSSLVMFDSFATPWTVACQAPLSRGFSRQEYWSGLPFPSPMHESQK